MLEHQPTHSVPPHPPGFVEIRPIRTVLLISLALLSAGCASTPGVQSGPGPADQPPPSLDGQASRTGMDPSEAARLEAIYWSQVESARNRFTEADVRFMVGMIGHHAQALVMAGLAPERAANPSVRTLARRIDNAQRGEIGLMERWLQARGLPVPHWHIEGSTLMFMEPGMAGGHHADHSDVRSADPHDHSGMPGMLTPAQLAELDAASGASFDRLFLTYMIQHHQGAVVMVRELLATDGAAQDTEVFRFASDVQVDQITEVARMERMLREIFPDAPQP